MDKPLLYELYDLIKGYMPLVKRLHEVRRKLMGYDKLGGQDMIVSVFEPKEYSYKQGMKLLHKYLTEPLTKEYAEYSNMMANIETNIDTTEKTIKERRAGAWCHGMQDKESMSAIIFQDKWKGKLIDIRTMAHEMNHGVHALFHMKHLEINNAGTPGYFYEAMAMQAENRMMINWIHNTKDKKEKIELLLQKLEDSFSAVFGQTIAHYLELGFYDGKITSYESFKKEHDKIMNELTDENVDHHEDIEGNLILRVHHFHYTLYCVKYVFAELLAAKLANMSFDKVATLSEDLIQQISKEDVETCFANHGINIKGLDWIKEVFADYEKQLEELEKLVSV